MPVVQWRAAACARCKQAYSTKAVLGWVPWFAGSGRFGGKIEVFFDDRTEFWGDFPSCGVWQMLIINLSTTWPIRI